ncbi:hypothetical protein B0O80DRAFT_494862 [Mortierella sp. GBAus27b]|nr:hypothetical protein B0O80DRAFT_494862 [Mortierella sp. GBAus27b]
MVPTSTRGKSGQNTSKQSHVCVITPQQSVFRGGGDRVSIGSDAVYTAEKYYSLGGRGDGISAIETIAHAYGSQAVVISVDPKKVYVNSPPPTM